MHSNVSNGSVPRYHSRGHTCPPPPIPPPPSAGNSLRSSAPMSLRSAGNSTLFRHSITMDSIPLSDTIVANEDRVMTANSIMKDKSQVMDNEIIETKMSSNILPIFIMEFLSLVCLSSLAYFLRFTDAFGVLVRGFYCDDKTISLPFRPTFGDHSKPLMSGFSDEIFYSITIGVPLIMITLCETLRMILMSDNKRKKVIAAQTGCITCRIHIPVRRIFRFIGGFAYGLLITSILTDILKLVSGRHRPYFLNVCPTIGELCKRLSLKNTNIDFETEQHIDYKHIWISPNDFDDSVLCHNQTELARTARMSFPSSTASIATYSAFFLLLYIYCVLKFRSGRIIRLWFSVSILICLLIVICGKVSTHESHIEDIVVSLIIGVFFSSAICYTHLNLFRDRFQTNPNNNLDDDSQIGLTEEEENAWFWKYFHIPRVNLLRRSARYLRKRDDSTTSVPVVRCVNGSAYVNPAFEHKDMIENNSTRSHLGYHDNYRH